MNNRSRRERLLKLRVQYQAAMKHANSIKAEINKIVKDCPHTNQYRQNDPSGGHDHAYTCLTCGKEW